MTLEPSQLSPINSCESPAGTDEAAALFLELAADLYAQGDVNGAVDAYEQAVRLVPRRSDLFVELGALFQELNQPGAAIECYREALEIDPDFIPARQSFGYLLCNLGEPEQGLSHYEHALRVRPSPMSHLLAATVLPAIYDSVVEIHAWRERFAARVQDLVDAEVQVETLRSQIPTNFYLAYQGGNDREIARNLGCIYHGYDLCSGTGEIPLRPRDGRLRIGFLSAFFRDHTIGRLNLGAVQHLTRDKFEVMVLSLGSRDAGLGVAFERAADRFLAIPRNVEAARQIIAQQDLDVLIFADVGMDAISSTLAYSRMAPVQCVGWGHPDTTGSPTIDYFLSGALMETAEADAHYTEQLIRLPLLGVYYQRPARPTTLRQRDHFGIDKRVHVYACPQTLYKLHPDFDAILASILAADSAAEILLLEGQIPNWTDRLRRRFERTLPEQGRRVRFLPSQGYEDFLSLLAVSDVILDPLHFGGGNSSYEALAMKSPIVTLPSSFLRGRITAAMYSKMGFTDLVVRSPEEYIQTAVRLATEPEYNREVRRRIGDTNSILFEDPEEVRGLEHFLWSLTEDRRLSSAVARS